MGFLVLLVVIYLFVDGVNYIVEMYGYNVIIYIIYVIMIYFKSSYA